MPERWVVSPLTTVAWRDGGIDVAAAGSAFTLRYEQVDVLRVLHAFAVPRTLDEAIAELADWTTDNVVACVNQLLEAQTLINVSRLFSPPDSWDRWSLAFHHSSRSPHFKPRYGHRTPAVAPIRSLRRLPLPHPSDRGTERRGRTLADLLEARSSVRSWPAEPIPHAVLSEFLWRCARNRTRLAEFGPEKFGQVSRPYPSGGAVYSLELYLVIAAGAVEAVLGGLYRYVPEGHLLETMTDDVGACVPFLDAAARSAGSERPPVLVVITSRFARQAEIYSTLAYSLLLKEVGGVFQTMYLLAEDIGLAPCALGSGVADSVLNDLCDVSAYDEPIVGEFMLGPR